MGRGEIVECYVYIVDYVEQGGRSRSIPLVRSTS